ncbi:MAG: hypothetical protein NC416_15820 [Eubacterium sp.]|nr:hypothetical protein [Eubacterium sp.]
MTRKAFLCICFLCVAFWAYCEISETESVHQETTQTVDRTDEWREAYGDLILKESVKRAALLYLDADATPELLTLKNGEYHLYTFDGAQTAAISMPDGKIKASAYAPKHVLENFSGDLAFCWFEYVPYQGLMRVHGGDEDRCDYYLRYQNGSTALELEAKFTDFIWCTYSAEEEIENEEFLSRLSDLGYDGLAPCAFLYDNIDDAYKNMGKTLKSSEVMDDFVNGKIDALYQVEEAADIPEESFVMRSYVDLYRDFIMGDGMGSTQYVDFDNDGEDELIIRDYMGNSIFLDVIGGTVYNVMEASGTANQAYAAEMEGKRVVVNADVSHGGRKFYIVKQYDSCGCLVDFFRLSASYDGKNDYSAEDSFKYREQPISMEVFEEIRNCIRYISIEEKSEVFDGLEYMVEKILSDALM